MAITEPTLWLSIASSTAAAARAAYHVAIFHLALRGTEPCERRAIIEGLSHTRQFAPRSLTRPTKRRPRPDSPMPGG